MMVSADVPLEGSNHAAHPLEITIGVVPGQQTYHVTVLLRRHPDAPPFPDPQELGNTAIQDRRYLTIEQLEELYGASKDDADSVADFAERYGLRVKSVDLGRRTISLSGAAAQFSAAFKAQLQVFLHDGGLYRGYVGSLQIPEDLSDMVVAVTGLDERPVAAGRLWPIGRNDGARDAAVALANARATADLARMLPEQMRKYLKKLEARRATSDLKSSHEALREELADAPPAETARIYADRIAEPAERARASAEKLLREQVSDLNVQFTKAARNAVLEALEKVGIKTAPQIARLYDFPADTDGSGQCIGIVEFGGYYPTDLQAYLRFLDLPDVAITEVEVGGGRNMPGVIEAFDAEVALDIQVIAGAAPGAELAVYFAPLHAQGFINAVQTALHDKVLRPSVISISWDLSEGFWLGAPMHVRHLEEVFAEAAALGVTILCSAGDYGSATTFHDGQLWVGYPASSPLAIACGGTSLSSIRDTILDETVWNTFGSFGQATGGGYSKLFPRPDWQKPQVVPLSPVGGGKGRGVPDMAGNADPSTGYLLQVHGRTAVIAGTSAIAPLFAALIARINQSLGKQVGYINPLIYGAENRASAFFDVVSGSNGTFRAAPGWDLCTGLGRPIGSRLRDLLRNAGKPADEQGRAEVGSGT